MPCVVQQNVLANVLSRVFARDSVCLSCFVVLSCRIEDRGASLSATSAAYDYHNLLLFRCGAVKQKKTQLTKTTDLQTFCFCSIANASRTHSGKQKQNN